MTIVTPASSSSSARQQQPTLWADANTMTFSGRVFHAELVDGKYGEFLAVQVISRPVEGDDTSSVIIQFNSSQLVGFYKKNGVPAGRAVTVTGNMTAIESSYTDKKTGEIVPLKRTRIRLGDTITQWGAKPSRRGEVID